MLGAGQGREEEEWKEVEGRGLDSPASPAFNSAMRQVSHRELVTRRKYSDHVGKIKRCECDIIGEVHESMISEIFCHFVLDWTLCFNVNFVFILLYFRA